MHQTSRLELPSLKVPHHVAIIMDGNRRFAKNHGLPVLVGYWKGAENLVRIVRAATAQGIKILTVYAFSTENWKRPTEEIEALMRLFTIYLKKQCSSMIREGVRLHTIGNLQKLSLELQKALAETQKATEKGERIELVLALNYGGRDDICRAITRVLQEGKKESMTEEEFTRYLDTAAWPDPDLFIRTSGERRQSNFLLWQLSYSEFYYTEVLWPDFDEGELMLAIQEYGTRERRFGVDQREAFVDLSDQGGS